VFAREREHRGAKTRRAQGKTRFIWPHARSASNPGHANLATNPGVVGHRIERQTALVDVEAGLQPGRLSTHRPSGYVP
jgi:hypothetical protein